MNVQFIKSIASMSGTVERFRDGRKLVARTSKRTGKTIFYILDPSKRSKKVKPSVQAHRSNFGAIASEVANRLRNGDTRPRTVIWKEVASSFTPNTSQSQDHHGTISQ